MVHYKEIKIDLPKCDTDIKVKYPNGTVVEFQFRLEGPTLDVCIPDGDPWDATCWIGPDMKDAPGCGHERSVNQIMLCPPPEVYERPEP